MKKLILFFLLFCSIYSFGEELTKEQQKMAWKFIHEYMLSDNYRPTIFRKDVHFYLKGEFSASDSNIVKDIVGNIQKAIPNLNIELTDKTGNFGIIIDEEKENRVITATSSDQEILSAKFTLLNKLNDSQKAKYYYFHLIKGLTFYKKNQKYVDELKGSVFTVDDFEDVTFSPFDLFILEKLYAPNLSVQLVQNMDQGLKQTAWSSIRDKFLGDTKTPIIYRDDIAIRLAGKVSALDSLLMNKQISKLRFIIPNRKIFLTDENPNLVFNFGQKETSNRTWSKRMGNAIKSREIEIDTPEKIDLAFYEKLLYFKLNRSLVDFSPSRSENTTISGCVFDENKPDQITYHPFDMFILNTLYADDFNEQFKKQYVRQSSYRSYLVFMYHKQLNAIFFLFAFLFSGILLIWMIVKGVFKPHGWRWKEYNKQGIYLAVTIAIFLFINSCSDLQIIFRTSIFIINLFQALIAINLIFLVERFIFRKYDLGGARVIVISLITFVVTSNIFVLFKISYLEQTLFYWNTATSQMSLTAIIAISLGRGIYIFLNDRNKSIIHKKDLELAKMNELHKQAELQSLRAKINPHFLYNSLNSIASLASSDSQKTEQMALALSDFFKYAINREQKQLNTLSEELNVTRTYLEIEKVRFGDRLRFEIDCPAELSAIQIPQLLIQPLVENAIKHGLSQIVDEGLIRIVVEKAESRLNIRVYDNGPAFPDGPLTGFGIRNTQDRIMLLYGDKASVNWTNVPEKYIMISLPFPKSNRPNTK